MAFMMKAPEFSGDDMKKSIRQIRSWLYQLNEYLRYALSNLDEDNFSTPLASSIGEIAKLQTGLQGVTEDVGGVQTDVSGVQEDVSGLREDLSGAQESLALLQARVSAVETRLAPPEWTALTTESITPWVEGSPPHILRCGNMVAIEGGVRLNAAMNNRASRQVATLAAAYTPRRKQILPLFSDSGLFRAVVDVDGTVIVKNLTGGSFATDTYLSLSCGYAI